LLLALGLALGCASNETRQSIQTPSNDAASVSRVLDDLIERSHHINSFVADYRVNGDESSESGRVRIVLDALGQMGLEMAGDKGSMSFWEANGMLCCRQVEKDGTRKRINVPLKEMIDRDSAVIRGLDADFPKGSSSAPASRENGWAITCSYDKNGAPGKQFDVRIGYGPSDSMFGWLDWLKSSEFACTDHGDVLTFDLNESTHLDLSKESGFVTSIRVAKAAGEMTKLELEHIDLAPTPDVSVFDVATNDEGFVDGSSAARERLALTFVRSELDTICARMSMLSPARPDLLRGESRDKLNQLFDLVHRGRVELAFTSWVQKNQEWVEVREAWLEQAYETLADEDHDSIVALDAEMTNGRERLQENLTKASEGYCTRLAINPRSVPSDELRQELQQMVDEAAVNAFDTEISSALLRRFDEQMSAAQEHRPGTHTLPK
jgi:hypothetical protein